MLDIRDMSEKDKMFYFLEGLKSWARIELQRQRVQDVATAMAAAECLNDYSDGPSKRKTLPSNGSSSTFGSGGKAARVDRSYLPIVLRGVSVCSTINDSPKKWKEDPICHAIQEGSKKGRALLCCHANV